MQKPALQLEELTPLDLRKCRTVGEIVQGMSRCSFGARMLGEVASTLAEWVSSGDTPFVVYDGKSDTPLGRLLARMLLAKWFRRVVLPQEYSQEKGPGGNLLVVGPYPERYEDALYNRPKRTIFINQHDLARPGQIQDGYFPDAVFADPRFILPILFRTLQERLQATPSQVTELLTDLEQYGGVGAEVAHGAQVLRAMIEDSECTVFLTVSGAMTIAQMGLVICEMIEQKMVQSIATTGALVAHGLVESIGLKHYKHRPTLDDAALAKERINRVTDTLEPEDNLSHVEEVIGEVIRNVDGREPISPRILNHLVGRHLAEKYPNDRGILKSAYEHGVPVLIPAFADSEIANDVLIHNRRRVREGKPRVVMDLELDGESLVDMVQAAKRTGIFTIGGGVPRNYIQNVAPLMEIMSERLSLNLSPGRFSYGCRICPDRMHYGHLSGCTYEEGKSWRKMDLGGRFSEIHADATQVWPFLVKYILETRAN